MNKLNKKIYNTIELNLLSKLSDFEAKTQGAYVPIITIADFHFNILVNNL